MGGRSVWWVTRDVWGEKGCLVAKSGFFRGQKGCRGIIGVFRGVNGVFLGEQVC